MNMLKVLKLSVLSLLIFNTSAFAATPTKSQTYPMNGTYVQTIHGTCNADVTSPLPSGIASTFFKDEIIQGTFIPEPTLGFNSWVASLTSKSIPSPVSQIGITQDPTSTTRLLLAETPIQWGEQVAQNTNLESNAPYATAPVTYVNSHTNLTVLTTFNYSIPANNSNFKTGYALYSLSPGDNKWTRLIIYINPINSTTKAVTSVGTSAVAITGFSEVRNIGGNNYTYDCTFMFHVTK